MLSAPPDRRTGTDPTTGTLLKMYEVVKRSGALDGLRARRAFQSAYFFYKRSFEDPFQSFAQQYYRFIQGGHVLDVGANIGYTALVFSNYVSPGCVLYAFEPDRQNFELLVQIPARSPLKKRLIPVHAAAGEKDGSIDLWLNRSSHADHRICTPALRSLVGPDALTTNVNVVSLDSYLAARGHCQPVSFVKIDVQGYELQVCRGMQEILEANDKICVAFEYSPDSMRDMGEEPHELLRFFVDRDFHLYALERKARLTPVSEAGVQMLLQRRPYFDIIAVREKIRFA